MDRNLLLFAALNGVVGVTLGAFAAHGAGPQIKDLLATGAHYQLVHAALAAACALSPQTHAGVRLAGWVGAAGGLVFCLALALVGLADLRLMGAVAPVGGLLMIGGWGLLAVAASRARRRAIPSSQN